MNAGITERNDGTDDVTDAVTDDMTDGATDDAKDSAAESALLAPVFTPHGRLALTSTADAPLLNPATAARLRAAFANGSGAGLLQLGAGEVATALPAVWSYWRD